MVAEGAEGAEGAEVAEGGAGPRAWAGAERCACIFHATATPIERAVLAMSIGIQWWYSGGTTSARTGRPTWEI